MKVARGAQIGRGTEIGRGGGRTLPSDRVLPAGRRAFCLAQFLVIACSAGRIAEDVIGVIDFFRAGVGNGLKLWSEPRHLVRMITADEAAIGSMDGLRARSRYDLQGIVEGIGHMLSFVPSRSLTVPHGTPPSLPSPA